MGKTLTQHFKKKFTKRKNLNLKDLRTTGFNLCNNLHFYKGKRSVHSISCMKEGMQTNKLFVTSRCLFITKDSPINLDERVMVMELKQLVVKCKNSDGRYENSVQIIASFSITQLAYLIIKSNPDIFVKGIDSTTLDGLSLKSIQKISQDVLSDKIKSSPVRRVYILKPGKFVSRLLGVSNPREKIKKLWKLF